MLDLGLGDVLTLEAPVAFLLQVNYLEMIQRTGPLQGVVLGVLICFSIFSLTIIFAKWSTFRGARRANSRFLRAFRKATGLDAVMVASE